MSHSDTVTNTSVKNFPPASLLPVLWFFSLALLSAGSLFLEITLTRLFSTIFYPPYVFAVISLAVLGIGLGAALAAWQPAWRSTSRIVLYIVLAGLTTLILLLTAVFTAGINLHGGLLLLVPLPYIFVGLALTTFFSAVPAQSPQLYRADLLGAGVGVLAAIPLLNVLGGINGGLLAATTFGLAALLLQRFVPTSGVTRYLPSLLVGLSLTGLLANVWVGWLAVDMGRLSTQKPISKSVAAGGRVIYTRWDSFARTDLVDPGGGKPYELYIDGAAASVMPPAGDTSLLRTDIGFFPFATYRPEHALIIGPGGGLDVLLALSAHTKNITAVEINPASVDIVNQFSGYHSDLYNQPGVRVLVDEGRSVLRREQQQYNLIYLSQVVTLAAERSGYALTENSVYTVEAFQDYLTHLQADGLIALKLYDELTLTRSLITAVTALAQLRGLSQAEAMTHIAIFLDPDADPPVPLLIVQNKAFSYEGGLALAGVAAQVGFVPLFIPQVAGNPALEAILNGKGSIDDIIADSPSDVTPTTDDRPFFYQFEPGLPQNLRWLVVGAGIILLTGGVLVIFTQRHVSQQTVRYAPLYFAALGVGFISLEIAIIQQTRLFLGHPTPAITTVLAVLLLGGGLGSGWAGRWPETRVYPRLLRVLGGIVVLALLWLLGWSWLRQLFLSGAPAVRVGVVVITLTPLAFLMGIPFPVGLRQVGQANNGDRHIALSWAINSVTTVAGSILSVSLAMQAGFSSVLLVGIVAYTVATILIILLAGGNDATR